MHNHDHPVWLRPGAIVWVGHFFHDSAGAPHAEVEPARATESVATWIARELGIKDSASSDWRILPIVPRSRLVRCGPGDAGGWSKSPEAQTRWELGFHDELHTKVEQLFPTAAAAMQGFRERADYLDYLHLLDVARRPMPAATVRVLPKAAARVREFLPTQFGFDPFSGDFGDEPLLQAEIECEEEILQIQTSRSREELEELEIPAELIERRQERLDALRAFWVPLSPLEREAVRVYINREFADIPRLEAALAAMEQPKTIPLPLAPDGAFPADKLPAIRDDADHRLIVRFFVDTVIDPCTVLRPLVRSYQCICPRWFQLKVWDELERRNESCVFMGTAEECERARDLWREEEDSYHFDFSIERFIEP